MPSSRLARKNSARNSSKVVSGNGSAAGAAEHHPVVVGIAGGDLAGDEEIIDEELRTQLGGVEGGELSRVGGVAMVHGVLQRDWVGVIGQHSWSADQPAPI